MAPSALMQAADTYRWVCLCSTTVFSTLTRDIYAYDVVIWIAVKGLICAPLSLGDFCSGVKMRLATSIRGCENPKSKNNIVHC